MNKRRAKRQAHWLAWSYLESAKGAGPEVLDDPKMLAAFDDIIQYHWERGEPFPMTATEHTTGGRPNE